jgi:hypothetical protein
MRMIRQGCYLLPKPQLVNLTGLKIETCLCSYLILGAEVIIARVKKAVSSNDFLAGLSVFQVRLYLIKSIKYRKE